MKKILFALRKPSYRGAYAQEILDVIMTAAAFDQEVSVLLLDNAVFQLKKKQNPENTGLKETAAIFKVLPLYQIRGIYAETESLVEKGLSTDHLDSPVIEIPRNRIGDFAQQFDIVIPG